MAVGRAEPLLRSDQVDQAGPAGLERLDRSRLHELVMVQLIRAIQNGQLKQGERLREGPMAERLGLSRGTVREAIRRLEQEGLVVSEPHRGSFVARLTREDAEDLCALRRVLESFAVQLAVPRVTPDALARMEAHVHAMAAASETGSRVDRAQSSLKFHEELCLMSGNRLLHRTWTGLSLRLWLLYFDPRRRPAAEPVKRALAHLELVDLLRRQDVQAAIVWIESHIDRWTAHILGDLWPT